jgi:hypothetical protein
MNTQPRARFVLASISVHLLCLCTVVAQQEIGMKLPAGTATEALHVTSASGTSLFRIGGDGNVGIGTAVPTAVLQLKKTGGISDEISFGSDQWWTGRCDTSAFRLFHAAAQQLYMRGDGKVGIGTSSPAAALDIAGSLISGSHRLGSYNSKIELMGTGSNGKYWTLDPAAFVDDQFSIIRYDGNTAVPSKSFLLTSSGNLGIGTATPAQKLVVEQSTADLWSSYMYTAGIGAGASFGLAIAAGTIISDCAFQVRDQYDNPMFSIRGAGGAFIGGNFGGANGNSLAVGWNSGSETCSLAVGTNANASGPQSVALGYYLAAAGKQGTFVLGSASPMSSLVANANNQFLSCFSGGMYFYSKADLSAGIGLVGGTSSWTNVCDRNKKTNFTPLEGETVLERIRAIPIGEWNYKEADPTIRYIGPMAQDFWQAFHLGGTDSLGINSISIDGVTMAAEKALEKRTEDIPAMLRELSALKEQLAELLALQEEVAVLKELLSQQRAHGERVYDVSARTTR